VKRGGEGGGICTQNWEGKLAIARGGGTMRGGRCNTKGDKIKQKGMEPNSLIELQKGGLKK